MSQGDFRSQMLQLNHEICSLRDSWIEHKYSIKIKDEVEVVDLAKDPNTGPLARSTTPNLKRDKALDPWTMPCMTFKTDIGAVDILCALISKVALHINAAEVGRHPDNLFVARQTRGSIFGDKQIKLGEEVAVPRLCFFDRQTGIRRSFLGLSHMFVAVPVAMQTSDVFMRRLRSFFVDAFVTFETVCVRRQNRLLRSDLS
jgi:hypothetical protein